MSLYYNSWSLLSSGVFLRINTQKKIGLKPYELRLKMQLKKQTPTTTPQSQQIIFQKLYENLYFEK